ncbi:MAG: acyl-CoA dehydrogenase, partial [Saprospiraceae bacterium]
LIINHPDVRRMLFLQKAITEASLSLLLECSKHSDIAHCDTGEVKENNQLLLELLTPIAKTYPSEAGRIAINNGLQILGGYGFCMDFPLQQYLRDIRIMSIYEGTTGIQSLDLLSRKIPMQNGKALQLLTDQINATIEQTKKVDSLAPYAATLAQKSDEIRKALGHLMPYAMNGDFQNYLADATIFMEMASNVVIAHQWLKMALIATQAIENKDTKFDTSFYQSKIHTMKFYFKYELPKTKACLETLLHADRLTLVDDTKDLFF